MKLRPSLDLGIARRDVGRLLRWTVVTPDAAFYRLAFDIQDRYRFSWWDSLLAAAAKQGRCTHLLTEDLTDGQRVAGVTVIDPFRAMPEAILSP